MELQKRAGRKPKPKGEAPNNKVEAPTDIVVGSELLFRPCREVPADGWQVFQGHLSGGRPASP